MDPAGPLPGPAGGDTFDERSEQATLGDGEWPVDERYLVEPETGPVGAGLEHVAQDEAGEVAAVPAAATRSRAVALAAAALLALLLAAAPGAWLVLRPAPHASSTSAGSPGSGAGGPLTTSTTSSTSGTTSTTATTTPAAPTRARAVPDARDLSLADARQRLSQVGLRARIRRESSSAAADQVLGQSPEPGSKLRRNAFVVLTVSSGPPGVALPSLAGLRADLAAKKVRALGLVPQLDVVRSTKPAGTVLGQHPAAEAHVARGSAVRLEVARNVSKPTPAPSRVRLPDVRGQSAAAARSRLAGSGLEARIVQVTSNRPQGVVVDQSPAAGTQVRKGATVRLTVSSGPALVSVPSVVGLDQASAQAELAAAGFHVRVSTESTTDPSQDGTVTAQDPAGGTKAPDGSTVTITVAQLAQP